MSDFSEALLRERCRFQLRRRDVGRAFGLLGDEGEALVRRFEDGEGTPTLDQFRQVTRLLPRLISHPPMWPHLVHKFGPLFDSERAALNRSVLADVRSGKLYEPERRKPLTFGEGLALALTEDAARTGDEIEVAVNGVGGPAGARDKLDAWLDDRESPDSEELDYLVKTYPTLRGLLATGACRRPTPHREKEKTMLQIQSVPDKPIKQQLAELIQRARVQRERSHRDIANKCNVSQDVVASWEKGEKVPNGREWAKLKANLFSLGAAQTIWRQALHSAAADEVIQSGFTPLTGVDDEKRAIEVAVGERVKQEEDDESDEEQRSTPWTDVARNEPPPPPLESPSAQPSFGQALRVARVNMGFTQEEMGELTDVSGTAISAWETESNMPTAENWGRLVTALPELKDCTPPGLREVRYGSPNGGPRYPRGRTQDPILSQRDADRKLGDEIAATYKPQPGPQPGTRALVTDDVVAQVGREYVQSLREVKAASERLRKAHDELERAKRAHSAAKTRADEAQRALEKVVEGE